VLPFVNLLLEIGEIVRYLPDKKNKISSGSPAFATAQIAPKIKSESNIRRKPRFEQNNH